MAHDDMFGSPVADYDPLGVPPDDDGGWGMMLPSTIMPGMHDDRAPSPRHEAAPPSIHQGYASTGVDLESALDMGVMPTTPAPMMRRATSEAPAAGARARTTAWGSLDASRSARRAKARAAAVERGTFVPEPELMGAEARRPTRISSRHDTVSATDAFSVMSLAGVSSGMAPSSASSTGGGDMGNTDHSGDAHQSRRQPRPAEDDETRKAKNRAAATRSREKRRAEMGRLRAENNKLMRAVSDRESACARLREEAGGLRAQVGLLTRLLEAQLGGARTALSGPLAAMAAAANAAQAPVPVRAAAKRARDDTDDAATDDTRSATTSPRLSAAAAAAAVPAPKPGTCPLPDNGSFSDRASPGSDSRASPYDHHSVGSSSSAAPPSVEAGADGAAMSDSDDDDDDMASLSSASAGAASDESAEPSTKRQRGVKRLLATGLALVAVVAASLTGPTADHSSPARSGTARSLLGVSDGPDLGLAEQQQPAAWAGNVLYAWGALDAVLTVAAVLLCVLAFCSIAWAEEGTEEAVATPSGGRKALRGRPQLPLTGRSRSRNAPCEALRAVVVE